MAEQMQAGMLTRMVAFDAPVQQDDGHHGLVDGWTDEEAQVKAAAHFLYLRGSEAVIAARLAGRQAIVVTVRNTAAARAITNEWRMRDVRDGDFDSGGDWAGPVFNVRTAPVPSQDRLWLEILVEGGVAA